MSNNLDNKSIAQATQCGCILETLFVRKFETMSLQEKVETVKIGKPTPILPNLYYQTKKFTRHFHESTYLEYGWLCGCKKTNRLYCWPCILFSKDDTWAIQGVNDLSNLINILKKHSLSKLHFRSSFNLVKFRNKNLEITPKNVDKFNETVKYNRHVICRIIDAIAYLVGQDLSLEVARRKSPLNLRNYEELITLLGDIDPIFHNHLNTYSVFKTASNSIQIELINCIAEAMTKQVKTELEGTKFVMVILGASKRTTNNYYFSAMLRYVTKQEIKERFITFLGINKDLPVSSIANNVSTLLNQYHCKEKLVAQTFDGAIMAIAGHKHLEGLITANYKGAMYFQHYEHKLNLIIIESLNIFKQCRIFFETLCDFREFFSNSSKRTLLLKKRIDDSFLNVSPTSWNYISSVIEVIMNVKEEFLVVLNTIAGNEEDWDLDSRSCARGYYNLLKEVEFNFLLNLFWTLFRKCEMLFDFVQDNIYDVDSCMSSVSQFLNSLAELRNNFEGMWPVTQLTVPMPQKRIKQSGEENGVAKTVYKKLFYQIIDTVIENVKNIYTNLRTLPFLSLLHFERFQEYAKEFPESLFLALIQFYGKHFDLVYLRRELMEIYTGPEFKKNSLLKLYTYLQDTSLAEVLPEVTKLCALFLTLAVVNPSNDDNENNQLLNRLRKYLAIARHQDTFTGIPMLAIEMEFFRSIMKKPNFHDIVTDIFSQKNQQIELIYEK
ncbi:uncharacterized protein [Rhodnius prolixus]